MADAHGTCAHARRVPEYSTGTVAPKSVGGCNNPPDYGEFPTAYYSNGPSISAAVEIPFESVRTDGPTHQCALFYPPSNEMNASTHSV